MGKDEYDQLMKFIEHRFDDLQVKQTKSAKDLQEKLTRTVGDPQIGGKDEFQQLVKNVTDIGNRMTDVNTLADSMAGLQVKVEGMDDIGQGVNFTPFLDKGQDPHSWWRDFQNCAEFKGYNSEKRLKILKMLLRNGAATWLDNMIQDEIKPTMSADEQLEAIRTHFVERFSRQNSWLQDHLLIFLTQKAGEPVQEFYSTLVTRASRLNKSGDEMLSMFLRGLQPNLKMYVLAREPKCLPEAFKLAKTAESLQTISDLTQSEHVKAYQLPGDICPKVSRENHNSTALDLRELREEISNLRSKVHDSKKPEPRRVEPRITRCFYCNIPGHTAAACRRKLRDLAVRRQRPNITRTTPRVQPYSSTRRAYPEQTRRAPLPQRRPQYFGPEN
jgi:hypothetical protein